MRKPLVLTTFAATLAIGLPALNAQSSSSTPEIPVPQLFYDANQFPAADPMQDFATVRIRPVELDVDLLVNTPLYTNGDNRIELNVFPDVSFTARMLRLEEHFNDGLVWVGEIESDPTGEVFLSKVDDVVIGFARYLGETYKVDYSSDQVQHIRQVDWSKYKPCGTGPDQHVGAKNGHSAPQSSSGAGSGGGVDNPIVDVMVVYSPQARSGQGGTSAIQALINSAISTTNSAYSTSQVTMRINLVHTAELPANESSSMSTELSRLRSTNDGFNDIVHSWRDTHGADMVAEISNGGGFCGIAYLMTNVSPSFASSCFSVTARGCAVGNRTFPHELGHNQGCAHDRQNASIGAYAYSFGYRTPNNQYRTVMAYSPGTRIGYFSNPNVSFGGFPMGIAHPASNSAENWRTLNNTDTTVANFRSGGGGGLTLANPSPGQAGRFNSFTCTGATPGQTVTFWWAKRTGTSSVPGCVGTTLGLSGAKSAGTSGVGSAGSAVLTVFVPFKAAGATIQFQCSESPSCEVSNQIAETF